MYFGLDVARGFLDSTLEIRATVDKDIPLPYTPATISGSEGAYLEIEDFGDKVVVMVLAATFIGVGALAGSAIRAELVTMAEAIALRISLFLSGGR